jgi:hypothetical protein
MIDHQKVIDVITRARTEASRTLRENPPKEANREEILGLAFKPGDPVRDDVTGQEGVILSGYRKNFIF